MEESPTIYCHLTNEHREIWHWENEDDQTVWRAICEVCDRQWVKENGRWVPDDRLDQMSSQEIAGAVEDRERMSSPPKWTERGVCSEDNHPCFDSDVIEADSAFKGVYRKGASPAQGHDARQRRCRLCGCSVMRRGDGWEHLPRAFDRT